MPTATASTFPTEPKRRGALSDDEGSICNRRERFRPAKRRRHATATSDTSSNSVDVPVSCISVQLGPLTSTTNPSTRITEADHFYTDGSVVIFMRDRVYKLHWTVLTRSSAYFARSLENHDSKLLPLPLDIVEGVPAIEVDANPDDFSVLLDTLYDATKCVFTLVISWTELISSLGLLIGR